jgi:gluconolactonase
MTTVGNDIALDFEPLAVDVGFTEGPVWLQNGELVFVSISEGRVYSHSPSAGLRVAGITGGGPNGAAEGPDGVVYVAQNSGVVPGRPTPGVTGGVQAVHPDGRVETVTSDPVYPNDLCFGPDGLLYVTDPTRNRERDDGRIWRVDVGTGRTELLGSVGWYPNGIGFAPGSDELFVARAVRHGSIVGMPVAGGRLGEPREHAVLAHGRPDGFAWDAEGFLFVASLTDTAPADLQVFDAAGRPAGIVRPGTSRTVTNLALSPAGRLAVTDSGSSSVIAATWRAPGAPLHPFRG